MEYMQMTLDDWVSMKESLKKDLVGIQESFVRIGYKLRKIEEEKLYEKDGYKSIAEFAEAEYKLSASTVSRFISINKKYSIDGYSEQLQPRFEEYGSSKLSEMLALPDQDLEMIRPEATRETIRELKRFNDEPQDAAVQSDMGQLIENFFHKNREELNGLMNMVNEQGLENIDNYIMQVVDLINPSGNKAFRSGMYIMTMYENDIMIKQYAGTPKRMYWKEFVERTVNIFCYAAGPDTWKNYFGEEETPATAQEETREESSEQKLEETREESSEQKLEEKTEAPVTKVEEKTVTKEVKETVEKKEIAPAQEVIEKPFGSRRKYLASLSVSNMAKELADIVNEKGQVMVYQEIWEDWLEETVDAEGETIHE